MAHSWSEQRNQIRHDAFPRADLLHPMKMTPRLLPKVVRGERVEGMESLDIRRGDRTTYGTCMRLLLVIDDSVPTEIARERSESRSFKHIRIAVIVLQCKQVNRCREQIANERVVGLNDDRSLGWVNRCASEGIWASSSIEEPVSRRNPNLSSVV